MIESGAYVCVVEARVHVEDSGSLKSKRKVVRSLKDGVRTRFGAAVAEVGGQDKWQRTTLLIAIVGGPETAERASEVERFIAARCPDGSTFIRDLRSLQDLRG